MMCLFNVKIKIFMVSVISTKNTSKPKIAIIVSAPLAVRFFLINHIKEMVRYYSVVLYTSSEQLELLDVLPDEVNIRTIPIKRDINVIADLLVLFRLFFIFRREKYVLVHSVSPKAGLLAMISANLAFVPHRIHTFTGQVWVTSHGVKRWLLKFTDKVISECATMSLVDSDSQREFLIEQKVVQRKFSRVLGEGSISGVDLSRFRSNPDVRRLIRDELKISDTSVVILYLGRLKRDKGVKELARAYAHIADQESNISLVIVGPDEENMAIELKEILKKHIKSVRIKTKYTSKPEAFMQAADIFCLPSYREGFGSVIIEAAACGVPSVASKIYGLTDAIEDSSTGILVEPGNAMELSNALLLLVNDGGLRKTMGLSARKRVAPLFSQEHITELLLVFYNELLDIKHTKQV